MCQQIAPLHQQQITSQVLPVCKIKQQHIQPTSRRHVPQRPDALLRLPSGTGRNVPGVLLSSESMKPALFFMTLWFHLVHDKKTSPETNKNTTLWDTMPKQLLYNTPDTMGALSLLNRANSYFGEQRGVCWFNFLSSSGDCGLIWLLLLFVIECSASSLTQ